MTRRRRTDHAGAIHHVMNRGVDRNVVFFGDADRVEFGRRLDALHSEFGIETLAYCLMPNHYHLLLRAPGGGLSRAMQHLGSVYTRHTNDRVGRDGPLFRGRFHAIHVTTDHYLGWVARYIHRNPLALPNVPTPEAYRWSSYRAYLGYRRAPTFLATDLVLAPFGHDVARFADWTSSGSGSQGSTMAELDDLRQLMRCAAASDDVVNGAGEETARVLDRTLELIVADQLAGTPAGSALTASLEFPSAAARRMALHRARRRLTRDPALQRTVQAVVAEIRPRRTA